MIYQNDSNLMGFDTIEINLVLFVCLLCLYPCDHVGAQDWMVNQSLACGQSIRLYPGRPLQSVLM